MNVSLKAFNQTGGQIRFFEKGSISIASEVSSRTYGITFEPIDDGIGHCIFQMGSNTIEYTCANLFVRLKY